MGETPPYTLPVDIRVHGNSNDPSKWVKRLGTFFEEIRAKKTAKHNIVFFIYNFTNTVQFLNCASHMRLYSGAQEWKGNIFSTGVGALPFRLDS